MATTAPDTKASENHVSYRAPARPRDATGARCCKMLSNAWRPRVVDNPISAAIAISSARDTPSTPTSVSEAGALIAIITSACSLKRRRSAGVMTLPKNAPVPYTPMATP